MACMGAVAQAARTISLTPTYGKVSYLPARHYDRDYYLGLISLSLFLVLVSIVALFSFKSTIVVVNKSCVTCLFVV